MKNETEWCSSAALIQEEDDAEDVYEQWEHAYVFNVPKQLVAIADELPNIIVPAGTRRRDCDDASLAAGNKAKRLKVCNVSSIKDTDCFVFMCVCCEQFVV